MVKDSKEYLNLCFELDKKKTELENLRTDIFLFNPNIQKLVNEITELEKKKKELEDQ